MRVVLINNHEQIGGGSERVYQGTARLLRDNGVEVTTFSCGEASHDPLHPGVLLPLNGYIDPRSPLQTAQNLARYIYWPRAARELRQLLDDFKPDVAHLHIFYGQLSSSILPVLKAHKVRTVMTVHEYRMLCPVSTLYKPALGLCERCASGHYRHAVRNRCNRGSLAASALSALEARVRDTWFNYGEFIDHFLMVSRFCKDKHVQYRPELAAKSSVLHNFVQVAQGDDATLPTERTALYAGRLSEEKGVDLLCRAILQIPGASLHIAGTGPQEAELKSRFGNSAGISFLGKLPHDELSRHMKAAWLTVVPSEWYENNPMSVIESLSVGTPVLGADIGGIPELIEPGRTGWLFEKSSVSSLTNQLALALSTGPAERLRMGQAAQAFVRANNSPQHHLTQLLAAYRSAGAA